MDGVIIDHVGAKIRLAAEYGFSLQPQETPSEILKNIIPKNILSEIKHRLYESPEIIFSAPPMQGVIDALQTLRDNGVPFFLISRRNPKIAEEILKYHKLWPKFFNENNTSFVVHSEDKAAETVRFGINYFLDDEREVLDKLSTINNKFLFDPYDALEKNPAYVKIGSWQEFIKQII